MGGPLNVREVAVLKEMGKIKQALTRLTSTVSSMPRGWSMAAALTC